MAHKWRCQRRASRRLLAIRDAPEIKRLLTNRQFTGMDMDMEIDESYTEVIDMLEGGLVRGRERCGGKGVGNYQPRFSLGTPGHEVAWKLGG